MLGDYNFHTNNKVALIIVVFTAFLLRIIWLENVPPGFYKDEAYIGYDAYSLILTGKDFHGNPWPLYFEDSGDWRNPIYYYTAIVSINFLSLSVFATRLPAVFFGLISTLALFLLAREMFGSKKALFAAALIAVSPWSLQFSRIAFEAAALPALFLLALWLFLAGLRKPALLTLSALFFSLSLYTYITAAFFVPLFLIVLFYIFKQKIISLKKYLTMPIILFFALSLPLAATAILSPDTFFARSNAVSVFSNSNYSFIEIIKNYLQYFSPDFLFLNGDHNYRMSPPGWGKLLWFMAPLVIAGIYQCLCSLKKDNSKLLIAWFLLFPIAGIFTTDAPYAHSTRSIVGIGLFELMAVVGAFYLSDLIKKHMNAKTARTVFVLFFLTASTNVLIFIKDYFFEYPAKAAAPIWFEDGLKEAFGYIEQNQNNYDYIILSSQLNNAKIYAAFYLKTKPSEVQTDNEKIMQCKIANCGIRGKILLLNRETDPQTGIILKTIKNNAGKNAFRIETININ